MNMKINLKEEGLKRDAVDSKNKSLFLAYIKSRGMFSDHTNTPPCIPGRAVPSPEQICSELAQIPEHCAMSCSSCVTLTYSL